MAKSKSSNLRCLAVILLLASVTIYSLQYYSSRPSLKNLSLVSIGLTHSEVVSLIGQPALKFGQAKREVAFHGDSDSPVTNSASAGFAFGFLNSDTREYWEYKMDKNGLAIAENRPGTDEEIGAALLAAIFHKPDETSLVIYFGPNGRVDKIQLPKTN